MCKFWDIVKSGWLDNKTQRKRNRISLLLMVVSLLIYIGVNSTVNSINSSVHDILYGLQARVLNFIYVPEYDDSEDMNCEIFFEKIEKYFENDDRVEDVFFQLQDTIVKWQNTKEYFNVESAEIVMDAFYESVLKYSDDKDLKEPKYDEVIIPKYIYDVGAYDCYNCFYGDELIGETITIRYEDLTGGEGYKEYEFKVIGTYDNVRARSMGCHIYVNSQVAKEIIDYNYELELANQEAYREELEAMGIPGDSYEASLQYPIGISVSEDYELDMMQKDLRDELDLSVYKSITLDDELQSYFKYVVLVGNIVAFMLLVVAVINIIISSLNEIKDRKWEFALKMAMGYKRNDVVKIFFFEKLINMIKALIIAVALILLYSGISTYAIQELMEYWKKTYVISIDLRAVLVSFVLVVMSALMGVLAARISINSINVTETLKSGD